MNRKKTVKILLSFGLLPLAILMFRISASAPELTDILYSRGVYPVVASVISTVTGLLPFSLAEFVIYGLIIFILYKIIRSTWLLAAKEKEGQSLPEKSTTGDISPCRYNLLSLYPSLGIQLPPHHAGSPSGPGYRKYLAAGTDFLFQGNFSKCRKTGSLCVT